MTRTKAIAAVCHVHSEWSYDGKWSLQGLADEFARRGYAVLLVSDHDRGFTEKRRLEHREACAMASSENILVVPGIEYSDAANIVHVLVWGSVPFLGEGLPTLELLKHVDSAKGVAVLAHPSRRDAWRLFDPEWIPYLLGIETWNRKTDGWAPSVTAPDLLRGTSLVPFACLDFHTSKQLFPLSMRLEIGGATTEASVLECLRSRRCHAMAFSRPIEQILEGWPRMTLGPAERIRRGGASTYRWLKKHARGSASG
jgi:hypothetical protein